MFLARNWSVLAAALLCTTAVACVEDEATGEDTDGSGDGSGDVALEDGPFARVGVWLSWGAPFVLSAESIVTGLGVDLATYEVETWSNEGDFVIARNAAANEYNPGAYSRFDFATVAGAEFYCQTAYDAATAAEALAVTAADSTDPATTGCGGAFPWSALTTEVDEIAVAGSFTDEFNTAHEITSELWTQTFEDDVSTWTTILYGNEAGFVLAINGADNAFNPMDYSRFEWVQTESSTFFCQTVFDGETLTAAMAAPLADNADLATGCGGFPWTNLTP
jgi:hypothetical protein